MQRSATLVASVAATFARIEEHGGDAVAVMHDSGINLDPDGADLGDLHRRLSRDLARWTPGEQFAQAFAAGITTGRHYERTDHEPTPDLAALMARAEVARFRAEATHAAARATIERSKANRRTRKPHPAPGAQRRPLERATS